MTMNIEIEVQDIDHLGLIAGIIDDISLSPQRGEVYKRGFIFG